MQLILPETDMRGTVECAVVVQRAAGSTTRFPAMPRAMLTLASATGGAAAVSFHSMTTRATTHVHVAPVRALGLVLPPDTAARVMGMSTGALADITLPWTEMIGPAEATRLDGALHCAGTDAARLQALQSSLRRVLASGCERTQLARAEMLQHLCRAVGRDGVQAATALGLGERQLERRCRALLGMTPKQMHRITRWHVLLSGALRRQRVPDADTALAAGFYDQSHVARESHRLSGATLREMLQQAHAEGVWWPLATQRLLAGGPG
ncbi:MAG: helix-turn-helix domain-containing protein [Burkholderiaceae bacterium]